ncbi:hypothetical protein D9M68_867410 [compost metagenome]
MNHYSHRIGDYNQATAHLSAVEDGIYSRMIRWYMASERPLPHDVKVIERRVRANTANERLAVQAMLGEFFKLQADGWHNASCDLEISTRNREKLKKANANERRRSRQEGRAIHQSGALETGVLGVRCNGTELLHRPHWRPPEWPSFGRTWSKRR